MSIVTTIARSRVTAYLVLAGIGIAGFVVLKSALDAAVGSAVGEGAQKAADASGTEGVSRVDPASEISGIGSVRTPHGDPSKLTRVSDVVDQLFGGGLSVFGGWLGSHAYDATHRESSVSLNLSNNGGNGNPYGGGPNILYQAAVDSSPVAAAGSPYNMFGYAATPNAQAPPSAPPNN